MIVRWPRGEFLINAMPGQMQVSCLIRALRKLSFGFARASCFNSVRAKGKHNKCFFLCLQRFYLKKPFQLAHNKHLICCSSAARTHKKKSESNPEMTVTGFFKCLSAVSQQSSFPNAPTYMQTVVLDARIAFFYYAQNCLVDFCGFLASLPVLASFVRNETRLSLELHC